MPASLFDAPPEIFRRIALFAVLATPVGSPRELCHLSQLCRAAHHILSDNTAKFYADILAYKFDAPAVVCRLGKSTFQENAKIELHRRFAALDIFRKGRLDDPSLTEAFWIAYLMLEEDSSAGLQNLKQLLWADLPTFLDSFIQKRLYEGSVTNNGWPLLNVKNSLAITLFWLLSSQCDLHSPYTFEITYVRILGTVSRETPECRDKILQLLSPFVFAAFRVRVLLSLEFPR